LAAATKAVVKSWKEEMADRAFRGGAGGRSSVGGGGRGLNEMSMRIPTGAEGSGISRRRASTNDQAMEDLDNILSDSKSINDEGPPVNRSTFQTSTEDHDDLLGLPSSVRGRLSAQQLGGSGNAQSSTGGPPVLRGTVPDELKAALSQAAALSAAATGKIGFGTSNTKQVGPG
ncbi:unnamed protein product, partial [Amoebophrya sp. A120]